jgi:hypothetical protein
VQRKFNFLYNFSANSRTNRRPRGCGEVWRLERYLPKRFKKFEHGDAFELMSLSKSGQKLKKPSKKLKSRAKTHILFKNRSQTAVRIAALSHMVTYMHDAHVQQRILKNSAIGCHLEQLFWPKFCCFTSTLPAVKHQKYRYFRVRSSIPREPLRSYIKPRYQIEALNECSMMST